MPRVTTVKKSQRAQGVCLTCRQEIPVGVSYKHASKKTGPRSSYRMVWCSTCNPKASQLASGHTSDLYAAMEEAENDLWASDSPESVKDALNAATEGIRGVGEEYQEGSNNIEEGFGHSTSQSEEMAEKAEELEESASNLENAASDLDELNTEYDGLGIELLELQAVDMDEGEESRVKEIEQRFESIMEEAREMARDALNEVSF